MIDFVFLEVINYKLQYTNSNQNGMASNGAASRIKKNICSIRDKCVVLHVWFIVMWLKLKK